VTPVRFVGPKLGKEPSVRYAASVLGCLTCLGLAACGGDSGGERREARAQTTTSESLPAAEYARRADKLCRQEALKVLEARTQERLRRIQNSSASEEEQFRRAAPILAEQLQIISEFRRRLELLGTPSAHRDDAERMVEKARSAEVELERATEAAKAGDTAQVRESLVSYYGFASQSASIARDSELNFAICGSGA
jgi:hypothetical protein